MRSYNAAMRGRRAEIDRQAIVAAFWNVRIDSDAQHGGVRLADYLDELKGADERLDDSSAELSAHFDGLIARQDDVSQTRREE